MTQEIARLRRQFADRIETLDETAWNSASWCSGWKVRDVLAHLVRGAEGTLWSMVGDVLRGGLKPDRAVGEAAKRLGDVPVPQLADRLRNAGVGGFRPPGFPEAMGLADVLVHSADAFRPLGLDVDAPPADAIPVLDAFWRRGRMVVHAEPQRGRRLVATDLDWMRGDGPEVRGKAIDLVLLVANRRQVLPSLEGPGLQRGYIGRIEGARSRDRGIHRGTLVPGILKRRAYCAEGPEGPFWRLPRHDQQPDYRSAQAISRSFFGDSPGSGRLLRHAD